MVARAGSSAGLVRTTHRRATRRGAPACLPVRKLVVALGILAASTGCSDNQSGSPPTPSTAASPAPSTTSTSFRLPTTTTTSPDAPVLQSIESYRLVLLDAFDPLEPSHPRLSQVATGAQLESWRRGMADGQSRGESLRGELQFRKTRVLELQTDTAKVETCLGDGLSLFGPDGVIRERSTGLNWGFRVFSLVAEGGQWKVSDTKDDGVSCVP